MSRNRVLPVSAAVLAVAATSRAADLPGSKDHPLVQRYEGSTILVYGAKAFDEYVLPLGPSAGRGNEVRLPKSARLEGRVTRITYLAPAGRSTLEVVRNYETELKAAGYSVVFSGAEFVLGGDTVFPGNFATAAGYNAIKFPGGQGPTFDQVLTRDQRFLAARLTRPGGDLHVIVYAGSVSPSMAPFVWAETTKSQPTVTPGRVVFQLDVIEAKAMDSRMVTVSAADLAAGIARTGSVAVYGIYFDISSAEMKPESNPTLEQIGKLLGTDRKLKLLVVGHTDSVGSFEGNMDLSQRRAAAVVKALTSRHGVDPSRLTPVGVSYACPVESNRAEEGRAKNRRVQLVER